MKSSLALFVLVLLLLNMLADGAPGANQSKGTVNEREVIAGLWQGFIAPFVLVVSLLRDNLSIDEVHNNGAWYNFAPFGLACFFGGSGNHAARRKRNLTPSA